MNNPIDFSIPFQGIPDQLSDSDRILNLTKEETSLKRDYKEISDKVIEITKSIKKRVKEKTVSKKSKDSELLTEKESNEKESLLEDVQKEISDAVAEIVEEDSADHEFFDERFDIYERERALYSFIEGPKGLDYSKLHYGKIAQPLDIKWDYNHYKKDDEDEAKFVSEETLSIKEIDKIIEQKMLAGWQRKGFIDLSLDAETNELFKYYKLFNHALIKVKYAIGFA